MHREQLFIHQLAFLIKQNPYSKVIEIGSSDLSEYLTLKSCFKNESFSHVIYEGLEETFELIKEKALKNYYKNISIFNKFVTPKEGKYYINNVKERNLISLSNDNFYKNKKNYK